MLVIVGAYKAAAGGVNIRVQRPQSSAQIEKRYSSPEEARAVLAGLGIPVQSIANFFQILPTLDDNAKWNFAPMDVPQHTLTKEFPAWKTP